MTKEFDPTQMTDEEIEEVADEVELQRKREDSKWGGKIQTDGFLDSEEEEGEDT